MTADDSTRLFPSLPMTQRAVLAWGAIVAVALLSFYVHVLQESVMRGDKLRAERSGQGWADASGWQGRAPAVSGDTRRDPGAPPILRHSAFEALGNVRP